SRDAPPAPKFPSMGPPPGPKPTLAPARGSRRELIPGDPMAGEPLVGKLRAVASLIAGVVAARRLLVQNRIEILIGFGGYATAGAIVAARSLGLKIAVHEANVEFGMTNRWLARL